MNMVTVMIVAVTAPPAGKVLQTRSRSGFNVAVHKIANYAI